ncbi:hypothetical protein Tco_0310732 [Tanacetum coccineum]
MSGTVPPIPPPLGTNTGNAASPNRVDAIPTDNTNNTTTNNVAQNVVNEDLPQLHDSRGGSHVTKLFLLLMLKIFLVGKIGSWST